MLVVPGEAESFGVVEAAPHESHSRLQRLSPRTKLPLHYPLEQPPLCGPTCRHDLDLAEDTETGGGDVEPLFLLGDVPQQLVDLVGVDVDHLDLDRDRGHRCASLWVFCLVPISTARVTVVGALSAGNQTLRACPTSTSNSTSTPGIGCLGMARSTFSTASASSSGEAYSVAKVM